MALGHAIQPSTLPHGGNSSPPSPPPGGCLLEQGQQLHREVKGSCQAKNSCTAMALKHTLKRIPWELSLPGQADPSSHRSPTVKVHLRDCGLPTPLLHSPFPSMPPQRNLHPCSCCGRSGPRQPFLQQTSS